MEENKQQSEKSKDQKRQEILEKGADMMQEGAKKLDELVNKRSALGEYSPAIVLGVLAMVGYALLYYPGILIIGAIGVAAGLAPKILKYSLAKHAEIKAKKADSAAKKDEKAEEKK